MAGLGRVCKAGLVFLSVLVGLVGLASGTVLFEFWLFLRTPAGPDRHLREVTIQPGMNAAAIARLLRSGGVIADERLFAALYRLRNAGHRLQAGEYAFQPFSRPGDILDQIVEGKVLLHNVTLPEGSTLRDVARILEERGLAPQADVMRLAADRDTIENLGLHVPSLEGYLFPETYNFPRSRSTVSILEAMVHQFWCRLPEAWQERTRDLGLSIHDVVILASMVEKEAVVDGERPRIAAVFFNRLERGMPLQSDPTAVYDLADFSGPITGAHLKRRSPYNTYVNKGLPAGPICNPGSGSLNAVLYPEPVPYLYFVSNNDGTHQFSETLAEHRRAVARYREKRKAATEEVERPFQTDPSTHGVGILEKKDLERKDS